MNNISWQGYWTALAITVSLYYLFVLAFYYKRELLNVLRNRTPNEGRIALPLNEMEPSFSSPSGSQQKENNLLAPETSPEAISLIDEVQAYFEGAGKKDYTKAEVLRSLETIIKKYATVHGSVYQYSVNNLILFLAEQSCSLHLSADDVQGVWVA